MSVGLMNKKITIKRLTKSVDKDGFSTNTEVTVLSTRANVEGRHGTEKWANLAAFSEATDLFTIRKYPNLTITTSNIIIYNNETYNILSVEDVKGRGLYLEIQAKKVVSSNG